MWSDIRGAVNIAPSGALSLSRILRMGGRPSLPIPHPLFGPGARAVGGRLGAGALVGDAVRLLRYGRGVDNGRMRRELGFEPKLSAVGAARELMTRLDGRRVGPPLHPGVALARLAGPGDECGGAQSRVSGEAPKRSPASSARSAPASRRASTRSRPPAMPSLASRVVGDAVETILRRLRGEYSEDEWGFDEDFAEAVFPCSGSSMRFGGGST